MAIGSGNRTGARSIESNRCFGPPELGYFPTGAFMQFHDGVEGGGWKMHITARTEQAEIVARIVLPILRELDVPHKVVANLENYRRMNEGDQKGKFITIYNRGQAEAETVLEAVDEQMMIYREFGGLEPGPRPMSREGGHRESELPIGDSGFIWVLYRVDYSR